MPPWVCVVGAELDMLAHESWRLACRLGNEGAGRRVREVPDPESADPALGVCGRTIVGARKGALESEREERFGWETNAGAGRGGVKWMLVPDVVHGFDSVHVRNLMGGEETVKDAEMKTREYVGRLGRFGRT